MITGAENKAFIEEKMERARSLATISESLITWVYAADGTHIAKC